jgi:NAD(P)H-binding
MKIAVIGASGWLGGAIGREAVSRGYEVTAIGRNAMRLAQVEEATAVVADLDDPESIVDAIRGATVDVEAVGAGEHRLVPVGRCERDLAAVVGDLREQDRHDLMAGRRRFSPASRCAYAYRSGMPSRVRGSGMRPRESAAGRSALASRAMGGPLEESNSADEA